MMLIAVSQTGDKTGLNAKILRIIDEQSGEILRRLFVDRVILRITERAQRDHAS